MGAKAGQAEPRGGPRVKSKAAILQAFDFLPAGFTSAEQFISLSCQKLVFDSLRACGSRHRLLLF